MARELAGPFGGLNMCKQIAEAERLMREIGFTSKEFSPHSIGPALWRGAPGRGDRTQHPRASQFDRSRRTDDRAIADGNRRGFPLRPPGARFLVGRSCSSGTPSVTSKTSPIRGRRDEGRDHRSVSTTWPTAAGSTHTVQSTSPGGSLSKGGVARDKHDRRAYQFVTDPSCRTRCGASQNLKLCFLTSSSFTSMPRPGASVTG